MNKNEIDEAAVEYANDQWSSNRNSMFAASAGFNAGANWVCEQMTKEIETLIEEIEKLTEAEKV